MFMQRQCKRNRPSRQRRALHTAVYTAPSGKEYAVQVITVNRVDNSAQIVYQWAKGKVVRAGVGLGDVDVIGKCPRCNGTGYISISGDDDQPCPVCGWAGDEGVF